MFMLNLASHTKHDKATELQLEREFIMHTSPQSRRTQGTASSARERKGLQCMKFIGILNLIMAWNR